MGGFKESGENSSHSFTFPPLNQLSVSADSVLSHADTKFTVDEESFECSLAKQVWKPGEVIGE